MTITTTRSFQPVSGARALLDQIADLKFSKHVPLVVVLLSAMYAVYRSQHWLSVAFALPLYVALPTALFLEALVLAAGAAVFIACREAFVAEIKHKDQDLAGIGVYLSLSLLAVAFVALLGIAWADAWLVTGDMLASAIMVLAQGAQAGLLVTFIISALLDERDRLRTQYADYLVKNCRYCGNPVAPNNRARHEASCPANTANQPGVS